MGADFSGYATKAGLKCSDGRTIMPEAFQHMDGMTVPLVWQHGHNNPENILGHAVLEGRKDGVYAYAFFNGTPTAKNAKTLVEHKDIVSLSIYANQLVERSKQVFHGVIREVSLVLSGANPGALIDNVSIAHSDGDVETLDDEAIIFTGLVLEHEDKEEPVVEEEEENENDDEVEDEVVEHADGPTIQDVYDSLSEDQKNVVHYMIGAALEAAGTAQHTDSNDEGDLIHKEGNDDMSRNVFEQNGSTESATVLSHEDVKGIVADAMKSGSLKEAVQAYALQHGIENIDTMFPDAKTVTNTPEFDKRRTEWVAGVLSGTRHSPFSRIKSMSADLTFDEARAKGYIKGSLKKEEFFGVSKRVTTPTTIYKKQKLDRDDIIDITDFDVVMWLKAEMRLMMDEELARAVLISDGRDVADEDKIKDPAGAAEGAGIRSIANDHELYAATVWVNLDDASSSYNELIEQVIRSRRLYKGTGTPTFYTTETVLSELLLLKDSTGRKIYKNVDEIANELRVSSIVPVEVMEDVPDLVGIIVNLQDYTIGADRGGDLAMFDDFDIDYNQYKYLLETRLSGGLTKIRSALVLRKTAAANALATPVEPAFVAATNTITIPTTTGVDYQVDGVTTAAGAVVITADAVVQAVPKANFYFANNVDDSWYYNYTV